MNRFALFAAGLVAVTLVSLVGCGPAKEKAMQEVEKEIDVGVAAAFSAADKNNDGKITLEEFAGAEDRNEKDVQESFKKLDEDGNGSISRPEFRKAIDKLRQGFEQMKKEMEEKQDK